MTQQSWPRPRVRRGFVKAWAAAGLALLLAAGGLAPAVAASPEPRPARGLIVKLKDAPANTVFESPQSADAQRARERAQRVLAAASLGPARLRPVGGSAQLLDFGRMVDGAQAQRLAERLRAQPEVEWVGLNVREQRLDVVPDDLFYPSTSDFDGQWWLYPPTGGNPNSLGQRLAGVPGFQTAWQRSTGAASAVVAVVDSGITRHPDLDAHVLPGYDFVADPVYSNDGDGRDADPGDPGDWVNDADVDIILTEDDGTRFRPFAECTVEPSSWHGTIIAGIVAAVTNNRTGVAGASWEGRVLPVRVAGKCGALVTDIVDGMRWAAGLHVVGVPDNPHPARIINVSFGSSASCSDGEGQLYQSAIDEIRRQKGAVVIAAAGNLASTTVNRPGSCDGALAVAALNSNGFKTWYSNFGRGIGIATVGGDQGAPTGGQLDDGGLLTVFNRGLEAPGSAAYDYHSGTSFSAPVVAGVASLMLSVNPGLSFDQIVDGLRSTTRPHVREPSSLGACSSGNPGRCLCTTDTCGPGILDADQAVLYARDPQSFDRGGGGALGLGWLVVLAVAVAGVARAGRGRRA